MADTAKRPWDPLLDGSVLVAAVCAIALVGDHLIGRVRSPEPATRADRVVSEWREYASAGHWIGPAEATVVIVEWGDYQCPFCRRLAPYLEEVLDAYPDDVALVYRHWPLNMHEMADEAARSAICAGDQGRFKEVHDLLYRDDSWIKARSLDELVADAGVSDLDAFGSCMTGSESAARIQSDVDAVRKLNGRGTPTVMINELLLGLPPDSARLHQVIRERLRR